MTLLSGQIPSADELNTITEKIIARGRRTTTSTGTTTIVGVLRLDDVPVLAGYTYRVYTSNLRLTGGTNDGVEVTLRYSTDGSTPTTASTAMATAGVQITNTAVYEDAMLSVSYTPSTDQVLSVLLCVARVSGSAGNAAIGGATTFPIELFIENGGLDVGNTGTSI